jgi:hypothetical protein
MIQAEPITAKEFFDRMVEVPPDNTCRTCFYFQSSIRWGTCNSPDVESRTTNALIHLIEFHETFGCRFHQPKEAQNG